MKDDKPLLLSLYKRGGIWSTRALELEEMRVTKPRLWAKLIRRLGVEVVCKWDLLRYNLETAKPIRRREEALAAAWSETR